jgi:hypothetical protein
MKPILKVVIVVGGYLLAFLMAWASVAIHTKLAGDANADASAGMSAFGDFILFIAVFGVVALLPSGAALFFLLSKKKSLTMRCSEPGHRAQVASERPRGPGR